MRKRYWKARALAAEAEIRRLTTITTVACVTPGCPERTDPAQSNLCEQHRREVFGPRP